MLTVMAENSEDAKLIIFRKSRETQIKRFERPGTVAQACDPSTMGG